MSSIPALSLEQITRQGLDPAFRLLPCKLDSPEARAIELAIGLQESRFAYRRQIITVKDRATGEMVQKALGPAKSFWQGEMGGGMVHGVRVHRATRAMAQVLYEARQVKADDRSIWNAIENDDVLAAGLARLLLYSDPLPLPRLGDVEGAWTLYSQRTWKPGRPHKATWPGFYRQAVNFVKGADL